MKKIIISIIAITFLIVACDDGDGDFDLGNPINFEVPRIPVSIDNPATDAGIQLGRMLFYEKKLSRTNEVACASCHHQEFAFSDPNRVSFGVDSLQGKRQAMAIFNLAFTQNGFFWDGRSDILRHQSLLPIENELELGETLENVITKLSEESIYQDQFNLAFGNNNITAEKIGLALEQFLSSMVSNNSKIDQADRGEIELTLSEENGRLLFIRNGCLNCHASFNLDDVPERFLNNGLDADDDMTDFGRELVTGNRFDRAKFKVPSLRNIAVTAPYMHDGRFNTLEEVIDHYASGGKQSQTVGGEIVGGFEMTGGEKTDMINFLKTLTDEDFLTNPDFSTPF